MSVHLRRFKGKDKNGKTKSPFKDYMSPATRISSPSTMVDHLQECNSRCSSAFPSYSVRLALSIPFMSWENLAKLSYSEDERIHDLIARKLTKTFEDRFNLSFFVKSDTRMGQFLKEPGVRMNRFLKFNPIVVVNALDRSDPKLWRKTHNSYNGTTDYSFSLWLSKTTIPFLSFELYSRFKRIWERAGFGWTHIIEEHPDSFLENPNTPADDVALAISVRTPRRKLVKTIPGYWTQIEGEIWYDNWFDNKGPRCRTDMVDEFVPERKSYGYSEDDVEFAKSLLDARPEEQREEILRCIKTIHPKLFALLKKVE